MGEMMRQFAYLSYWICMCGVLAVVANLLLHPERFTNPWTVLATGLALACFIAVPCFPLPSWVGYLVLFVILSVQPETNVAVITLMAPFFAAFVAYRGHLVAALCGSFLILGSASINPLEGIFLPSDWLAATIWAVILGAGNATGYAFYRVVEAKNGVVSEDNDLRDSLARVLHDSVATPLTSVVVRAETLSIRKGIEEDVVTDIKFLAEQARDSMRKVRSFLQDLENGVETRSLESQQVFHEQLRIFYNFLKEHGFTVQAPVDSTELQLGAERLLVLREVLVEIATNILKYAKPRSQVTIGISEVDGYTLISFENIISSEDMGSDFSTGLGLQMMSQSLRGIGGASCVAASDTTWRLKVKLPSQ